MKEPVKIQENKAKHERKAEKKAKLSEKIEKPSAPIVIAEEPAIEEKKAEIFSGDKFKDLPINDRLK